MPKKSEIKDQIREIIVNEPGADRNKLAEALGRPYMSPNDIAQLDSLIDSGEVVVERVPTGITQKFVYYPAAS